VPVRQRVLPGDHTVRGERSARPCTTLEFLEGAHLGAQCTPPKVHTTKALVGSVLWGADQDVRTAHFLA